MAEPNSKDNEIVAFAGLIGEVIHTPKPDGRIFEQYRRPPGVRIVVVSPDNKVLITKEHRHETGNVDLRLPGGKVRDTLDAWRALQASGQAIVEAGKEVVVKEGRQETGLEIGDPEFIVKATAGATVEWDLLYYLVRNYRELPEGQELELGENIEVTWMSPGQIRTAISKGQMQEWRSVGVLLGIVLPKLESI